MLDGVCSYCYTSLIGRDDVAMNSEREMKHTPAPWHIHKRDGFQVVTPLPQIERNQGYVDSIDCNSVANAAHLVKCVNLHDELVEALQSVDDLWGGDEGLAKEMAACDKLGAEFPVTKVWAKIRSSIAKARGEA